MPQMTSRTVGECVEQVQHDRHDRHHRLGVEAHLGLLQDRPLDVAALRRATGWQEVIEPRSSGVSSRCPAAHAMNGKLASRSYSRTSCFRMPDTSSFSVAP